MARRNLDLQGSKELTRLQIFRWLLCPASFVLGCWMLLLAPDTVMKILPSPSLHWSLGGAPNIIPQPVMPASRYEAWQLGGLARALNQSIAAGPVTQALLDQAAVLLKVPPGNVSLDYVISLGAELALLQDGKGPLARLAGVFSFVNFIWAMSIVGVSVSVGPFLYMLLKPFGVWVVRVLGPPIWQMLIKSKPALEVLAYWICLYIAGAAGGHPESSSGYLALTASLLSLSAFGYSTYLHAAKAEGNMAAFSALMFGYAAAGAVPLAVKYDSRLEGFLAVVALTGALGFRVVPYGLCWSVGWSDDVSMQTSAVTSALQLSLLIGCKAGGVGAEILAPFQAGLSIFGGVALFLAGLIMSSSHYDRHRTRQVLQKEENGDYMKDSEDNYVYKPQGASRYIESNIVYSVALVASIGLGFLFGLQSLANTGIVFAVLYAGEKMVEVSGWNWAVIFFGSLGLWQGALFCHSHPQFLLAMVNW